MCSAKTRRKSLNINVRHPESGECGLADLGFKKIAGKGLIFRHSAIRTPFGDRHPQGQDADVEALPGYEEWVEKEWEEFRDVAEE